VNSWGRFGHTLRAQKSSRISGRRFFFPHHVLALRHLFSAVSLEAMDRADWEMDWPWIHRSYYGGPLDDAARRFSIAPQFAASPVRPLAARSWAPAAKKIRANQEGQNRVFGACSLPLKADSARISPADFESRPWPVTECPAHLKLEVAAVTILPVRKNPSLPHRSINGGHDTRSK